MNLKREYLYKIISGIEEPVIISPRLFFDGNDDESSIGCNLSNHPGIEVFKNIFEQLSQRPSVNGVYIALTDTDPTLDWPFSDTAYVAGNIATDELYQATKPLEPDRVDYAHNVPAEISEKHPRDKIQVLWWD